MIIHYIILGSSYSLGKRIALDYYGMNIDNFKSDLRKIFEICGDDVSVSWHTLPTESEEWASVSEKDQFFKGISLIKTLDEFIELLSKDRELCGLDIAKYILSKIKCTHLKLQKLVYLCYADYLCETTKRLFEDKIYAFKYGPVVKSVYEECKSKYGYLAVDEEETITTKKVEQLPFKSRILVAKDGYEKWFSIDQTLEKYGDLTASQLVDVTHKPNSPWKKTYKENAVRTIIDDKIILKYHKNEIVD